MDNGDEEMLNAKDTSTKPLSYTQIAEKMKQYEVNATKHSILELNKPFLMRIDGHSFFSFTQGFEKPFDAWLHQIMVETCKDLIQLFNQANLAYTQSDEITLVFPACKIVNEETGQNNLPFGGRILKLCTLVSGYTSTRFNYHLVQKLNEYPSDKNKNFEKVKSKITGGVAYFDARIFTVENEKEVVENLMWRSSFDCIRNSKMNLGFAHFNHKALHNLNGREVVQKLELEKNIRWRDMPASYKYGTFVKRTKVTKEAVDRKTNQPVTVARTVVLEKAFGFKPYVPEYEKIIMARFWSEVEDLMTEERFFLK